MLALNKEKAITLALTGFLAFSGCVDNKYDLSDVDTDDVQVGGDVIAPLGFGSIDAGQLLDTEHVKEIQSDEAGNYRVVYENELAVHMPDDVTLTDVSVSFPSLAVPGEIPAGIVFPEKRTFPLGESAERLNFTLPREIVRLDSVVFPAALETAVFDLYVRAYDFSLLRGNAAVRFQIVFPPEYELSPLSADIALENSALTCRVSLDLLSRGVSIPVKIKKAVNGPVRIVAEIEVESGTELRKAANPRIESNAVFRNLDYEVVYGKFDMDFRVDPASFGMDDFHAVFDGDDNYLSFSDPHIRLITESNIGIPLHGMLSIDVFYPSAPANGTLVSGIDVQPAGQPGAVSYNRFWIGASDSQVENGYRLVENNDLRGLIALSPTRISLGQNIAVPYWESPQFFTRDPYAVVKYGVEIPFAVTKDFRANVSEMIDGVFDEDVVDYLFTNGTATISGKVKNTVPLNIEMNLVIEDESGVPVGIVFEPSPIGGSADGEAVETEVSYTIGKADMEKMKNARHIRVLLSVTSDERLAGKNLKENQKLELELKLLKTGGIPLN